MFIVMLKFSRNRDKAAAFMEPHKVWLKQGFDDGVFLMAGSLAPGLGGCVLAHNTSLTDLQRRVGADPFVAEEIVTPDISEVLPSRADNRLQFLVATGHT